MLGDYFKKLKTKWGLEPLPEEGEISLSDIGEDLEEKRSGPRSALLNVGILSLVFLAAFGLGRLSVYEETRPDVKIYDSRIGGGGVRQVLSEGQNTNTVVPLQEDAVVASQSGNKYHYPWCSGAKQIKEENKISFTSPEEARARGYTPAANCPGLR